MMYLSLLKGRVMWAALAVVAMGVVLGGVVGGDVSVLAQVADCPATGSGGRAPAFDTGNDDPNPGGISVDENTPPGVNLGNPISATDADEGTREYGDTLTYSLGASANTDEARADAASFDIDASTGQLITKAALDNEDDDSYSVMVRVEDSTGNCVSREVTIRVGDVEEPPAAPVAPTVVSGEDDDSTTNTNESTTKLKVVWHAPENTGPAIDGYEVQYKKTTETSFSDLDPTHTGTDAVATIIDLEADTSYQVRVRATNPESQNAQNQEIASWSLVGTGSTNKGDNGPPKFIDSGTNGVVERDVDENEEAGEDVGRPVAATDDGVLPLTYRLDGPDAGLFDFNPSLSQIRTKRGVTYNHEDPECGYVDTENTTECTYYVTVTAFDGKGGSDAQAVQIEVDDVPEAPGVPRTDHGPGDGEVEQEPGRELGRAGEHGAPHHRLRRAVPARQQRHLHDHPSHGYQNHHRTHR